MIKNYFRTCLRNIVRHPVYFFINLIGLASGITCCILIMLFVRHELSYDQFHSKKDRLYRINYDIVMGGKEIISPSVPVFVGPHLKWMFPEIEEATRFQDSFSPRTIRYESKMFDENNFAWADSNFFKVLDFESIRGDLKTALNRPGTLVITESIARKYFGDDDPIGKSLVSNNNRNYEVTAVIKNVPGNSHFTFDFLTSLYSIADLDESVQWNNPNYATFLLVKPNVSIPSLQDKINLWVNPPEKKSEGGNSLSLPLESLNDVHFNTVAFNFGGRLAVTDIRYLYIFITIAVLILSIACINYINLSTTRASTRAKEVGLRKTVGASFRQTVFQFLVESFVLVLPAILFSMLGVVALLPLLNDLLGKTIEIGNIGWQIYCWAVAGWVLLSLLAGLYPAFVLSQFKPISVLKGDVIKTSGLGLRKGLVVMQFTISISLLVGTLVVVSQLNFMQSVDLGMNKEQVVMVRGNLDVSPRLEAFIEKIKSQPGVTNACRTWRSPFLTVVGNGFNLSPNPENDGWVTVGAISGDQDYMKTLGMELLAGRNFDPAKVKDTVNEFIVNEAFLRDFGLTAEEAIGKQSTLGMIRKNGPGTIVGVVKDFHFTSLHHKVEPIVLFNHPDYFSGALVRLSPGNTQASMANLEKVWKEFAPLRPFNFTFLDEEYDSMYRTEQRVSKLVSLFSIAAIVIACLGLMGLSSFTTLQRAKEMSIRKVLGATTQSIILLLTSGYMKLLLTGFIIAVPISYYLLNRWLEGFAYRIEVAPIHYLIALVGVVVLAWVTVGYQSFKASSSSPAETLKNE